jgi:hypothetical protein
MTDAELLERGITEYERFGTGGADCFSDPRFNEIQDEVRRRGFKETVMDESKRRRKEADDAYYRRVYGR